MKATDPLINLLKTFVGSLFKFQLDILIFAGNICPFRILNTVGKILLKLLYVPSLFTILLVFYLLGKLKLTKFSNPSRKWKYICGKVSVAIMLAILFSY